jgi:N-acetylmuramoyl-L-alanine amidase
MLGLMLALTVVIDPGHGGSNTGAPGRVAGVWEKQVTMRIARALKRTLEQEGVHVVMTRERDTYLTLRERVRRANAAGADCFLSLHTNATLEHGRRGIETWVLDREAADVEARRAVARAPDAVQGMLTDLTLLESRRGAIALARAVQARLWQARGGQLPASHNRGVKQAAWDVLAGVEVPAILVEVGFIDHPIEGVELLSPEVQQTLARALADGVFDWLLQRRPATLAGLAQPAR